MLLGLWCQVRWAFRYFSVFDSAWRPCHDVANPG